jgi:hypothetical protein
MSISQSLALRVLGVQVGSGDQVGSGPGGRILGVLDQHPALAVVVVVVVAVGDARSRGASAGRRIVHCSCSSARFPMGVAIGGEY